MEDERNIEKTKVDRFHFLSVGNDWLFLAYLNVITAFDANDFASIVWFLEND